MTEYHRRTKIAGTYEAVEIMKEKLAEKQAEREAMQEKTDQARKVADRWATTHHRRLSEVLALDRQIADITAALDTLAPEVDEYGIERKERERSRT